MADIVDQLCAAADEIKKLRAELDKCKKAEYLKSKYRSRRYRIYMRLKREFEENPEYINEVDRLRAALHRIADEYAGKAVAEIARAALGKK